MPLDWCTSVPSYYLQTAADTGRKSDEDKRRYDLIPWRELGVVVDVITYGMKKYSIYGECTCGASRKDASESHTPAASAATATTGGSRASIPSTESGNWPAHESGDLSTVNTDDRTSTTAPAISQPSGTASLAPTWTHSSRAGASSAAGPTHSASTTTTPRERCAAACASHATSASAGSRKSSGPIEHAPTCNALRLVRSGAGNWRHVPRAHERYMAAAMRHLAARAEGVLVDEESGLPHLAHAVCSLLFAMHFDRCGVPEVKP